jgi:hippurate hydrolase
VRKLLADSIREIAETTVKTYGCTLSFEWEFGYPPTINHALEAGRAATVMRGIVGDENVDTTVMPSMGAEDFSYMLEERPGAYIWLGSGPAKANAMLHSARYDFNDDVLALGASYWARLVESELPK